MMYNKPENDCKKGYQILFDDILTERYGIE